MPEAFDWRKLRVNRDDSFDSIVEKLCTTKGMSDQDFIFSTVKELMVFAALIGFQLDKFVPLKSGVSRTSISLETYANTNHDAYIYLIALTKNPTLDILKDEKLRDAILIFEGYCNAGLMHIDNWILENINEPILEEVLFKETLAYLNDDAQ